MQFSEHFKITKDADEDWYDPILLVDTPLFIDPFLIYSSEEGPFEGSHAEIIEFFTDAFRLVAKANGDTQSIHYRRAVDMLRFPEVDELCLGYTKHGTKGLGSGLDYAHAAASAIWEAIVAGVIELSHFEEISLLRMGIGPDRISDTSAFILRHRFAVYTELICKAHQIPTKKFKYQRGIYSREFERWIPLECALPVNPLTGKALLLTPHRYLRTSPNLNTDDFWDYCWDYHPDVVRDEFGHDVTKRVPKEEIIKLARDHADIRQAYLRYREQHPAKAYDLRKDIKGFVQWYRASKQYCSEHKLHLPVGSSDDLHDAAERMLNEYRNYIENNNGHWLLWNDDRTPKGEKATQYLLLGIVKHYCQANDIDISPEVNIGRGPVDFKVSKGYSKRVLIEVKLAKNTKFWNGLQKQLPMYLKSESADRGFFVVIAFSQADLDRIEGIDGIIASVNEKTGCNIRSIIVDARPDKPSASKL